MVEVDQFTIEKAKRGDKKAFQVLYNHYSEYIWIQVYRTVNGSRDDATELFQLIFIHLFRKLHRFSGKSRFSTWLYRLAYNEMMEHFRKKKRYGERFVLLEEEHYQAESRDAVEEIQQVLAGLNPHERYLLTAREVEGLSFEELAEVTGKSSASLRTAVSRIKAQLREEYGYE